MRYSVINEEIEKKIAEDPEGYVFFERVGPCRFAITTIDGSKAYPEELPAADFSTFKPKKRKIVFFDDPKYDIIVSRVVRDQPFLYPDDERDFDLLNVLQCTEIKTEHDTYRWDAPGMWYNKDMRATTFWARSNK